VSVDPVQYILACRGPFVKEVGKAATRSTWPTPDRDFRFAARRPSAMRRPDARNWRDRPSCSGGRRESRRRAQPQDLPLCRDARCSCSDACANLLGQRQRSGEARRFMPNRLIRPGTPCSAGPWIVKSCAGAPGGTILGRSRRSPAAGRRPSDPAVFAHGGVELVGAMRIDRVVDSRNPFDIGTETWPGRRGRR